MNMTVKRRQRNLLSFLTNGKHFSNNRKGGTMVTGGIFGAPLKSAYMCGSFNEEHKLMVPDPVYRCFEEIIQRGLLTEGIFRLSGSAPEIEQLCFDFDRPPTYGKYLDLKDKDIHAIASVVKKYLRQLPDPPIPILSHDKFIRFFDESYSNKATIRTFATMIQQLPREHFQLVQYIIILASSIQKHSHINLMNPEALAVILAPVCTGLELNLKEVSSWVKRRTKYDMNHYVEINLKWTRIFTLLIEYSDTLLELWNDTPWSSPLSATLPCRPSFNALRQESLSSFDETELLRVAPFNNRSKRTSSGHKELYKVVIMRPRYSSNRSQMSLRRASMVFEEDEDSSTTDSIQSLKSSLYSRSSVSLGNLDSF
ncbi:unnamed protein product [Rhizopus stolonifer]